MFRRSWIKKKDLIRASLFFHQSVSLSELPAVVVFKDGSHFTYDGGYLVALLFV